MKNSASILRLLPRKNRIRQGGAFDFILMECLDVKEQISGPQRGKRPADVFKILFEVWIGFRDCLELPLAYYGTSKVRGEAKPGPSAGRGGGLLHFQRLFRSCQLSKASPKEPAT